jgi:ABC-type nitrate/sulfonate/bicarbonate transport system permease component
VGLRDGELLPRRTRTPRCRIDPAAFRISHTVEDATWWPSLTSSPWIRRWPHIGSSLAIVSTSFLTAAAVGGLPGFCRALWSHLRATSRRCQANTVAGLTGTPQSIADAGSTMRVPRTRTDRPARNGP